MSSTQYTLRLLTEYAYALDLLPLELSKNLADLRELDAVLSAPIATITNKFNLLADVLEGKAEFPEYDEKDSEAVRQRKKNMSKAERLEHEFNRAANDAKTLKLGSDDKIKVASQTADLVTSVLLDHYIVTELYSSW
jgi:inhibitor of growth protein 3